MTIYKKSTYREIKSLYLFRAISSCSAPQNSRLILLVIQKTKKFGYGNQALQHIMPTNPLIIELKHSDSSILHFPRKNPTASIYRYGGIVLLEFHQTYFSSGQKPLLASIISSRTAFATFMLGMVLFSVNACRAFS